MTAWMNQHINLTYIIGLILTFVLVIICAVGLVFLNPYATDGELELLGMVVAFFGMLVISTWLLYKKSRSYAWLILSFGILGIIINLCLTNKREQVNYIEGGK